jgi:acyl carrier protein
MADGLVLELKKLIIATLKLEEVNPEDIEDDGQLFGTGLGLDSIDALELVVALEKKYGVAIPDSEVGERVFRSVNTLAQFVREQSKISHQPSAISDQRKSQK